MTAHSILYIDNTWNINIKCNDELFDAKEILEKYLEELTQKKVTYSNDSKAVMIELKLTDNRKYNYKIKNGYIELCGNTIENLIGTIYTFLENELGCRYLNFDSDYVPRMYRIELEDSEYEYYPPFITREIFAESFGGEHREFCQKHRINVVAKEKPEMYCCHSFNKILKKELFDEHPEYFALIGGKRRRDGEPCLTNPELQQHMIDVIAKDFAENPHYKVAHISQNDDANYCRCESCKKRDELDGGQIGSILDFVNKVADAFPDKTIITFAYWYSTDAPLVTNPRDNVVIELCNIAAKPSHSMRDSEVNKKSREELLNWSRVTKNIRFWDYNCQFRNFSSPFPNFEFMFDDMQYFVDNGVNRMFRQSAYVESGDMWQLRCYLLAKSLWNPDLDWRDVVSEFCDLYYGPASTFIKEYVFMQHQLIREYDIKLDIFDNPAAYKHTFLKQEYMEKYFELFEKAKFTVEEPNFHFRNHHKEVAFKYDYLSRVKEAEMSILYAAIYNRYGSREEQMNRLQDFYNLALKHNLRLLEERDEFPLKDFVLTAFSEIK